MKKLRIFLTRHGETQWNAEWRIQGHTDMELNENGLAQARALAARMEGTKISVIYSSDLARSSRTAAIVQEKLPGSRMILSPLLRERNWGAFEGKQWKEIEGQMPEEIRRLKKHPVDFKPGDGESRRDVLGRITEFMDGVRAGHDDDTIMIVTHGGVSSLMIKYITGLDLASITPFKIDNCSLNIIDLFEDEHWLIQTLNDVSHLEDRRIV